MANIECKQKIWVKSVEIGGEVFRESVDFSTRLLWPYRANIPFEWGRVITVGKHACRALLTIEGNKEEKEEEKAGKTRKRAFWSIIGEFWVDPGEERRGAERMEGLR